MFVLSKFVGEVLIRNSSDIRHVKEDSNQGPRHADRDQFGALDNEGRDRDHQVCQIVPPLREVLKIRILVKLQNPCGRTSM